MPELKVQHYIYQLFLAIDHTHRAGIYHRDIKPENILITKDTLKVADFGSCRSVYSKQPLTGKFATVLHPDLNVQFQSTFRQDGIARLNVSSLKVDMVIKWTYGLQGV